MKSSSVVFDFDSFRSNILREISGLFDASVVAHDLHHLDRVAHLANSIRETTGGNPITVVAASYLHDYHRFAEKRFGRHVAPAEVEGEVVSILQRLDCIPRELYAAICSAINFTEYYECAGDTVLDVEIELEAKIVRDADLLDALGAVGVARAFMFGGFLGEPMWTPASTASEKFVHGKSSSVVNHFHEKLLHLENEMMTEFGARMARERSVFMRQFLDQLMADIAI